MRGEALRLGVFLRYKREKAGLTQPQLADRIGCSISNVSVWESGKCFPSARYIKPLADYMEVSEKDVLWMIYREQKSKL